MGWEGRIGPSLCPLWWHYLITVHSAHVLCRCCLGFNHIALGLRSIFYSSTNLSCSPVKPGVQKATRASSGPYPCILKEKTAKTFRSRPGSGHVSNCFFLAWCCYCSHAQGHCQGSGLPPIPPKGAKYVLKVTF